ncbi:MAG: putative transporter [Bacteroidota bacterium]|nr:putative transporter [Bacteroidota bacterium]MDP4275241.1 putative transporter [Bacteroidota bacterium]
MEWINDLLWKDSVAHVALIYSFVIAIGVALGKLKVYKISLGTTFVLFVGIVAGHFGFTVNHDVLDFVRDFGLILFVFSIGLQVGPGFFSSLKNEGLVLNLLATSIVLLGSVLAVVLHYVTKVPMSMMVGILSGAVTNTPGLGAAQQTLNQFAAIHGGEAPNIGLGYAVAYPFGVLGIILTMFIIRWVAKVDLHKESKAVDSLTKSDSTVPEQASILVSNSDIFGMKIKDLKKNFKNDAIVSRVLHEGKIFIPTFRSTLKEGDVITIVAQKGDIPSLIRLIGKPSELDLVSYSDKLIIKQVCVTNRHVAGRTLGSLKLRLRFGIGITRVHRAGMDFIASQNMMVQMGDKLTVIGEEKEVENVSKYLGNSVKRLNEPNLSAIFIGILVGVVFGSIPIAIPGIPVPIKFGLAGGPLIIAILIGRYGYKFSLNSYTTLSANLMLRELGLVLFLSSVGIKAGEKFVSTLVSGDGFIWMGYGAIITLVPILLVGLFGKLVLKRNYHELCGVLSGSTTDPPALGFASSQTSTEAPALGYATVYPWTMFLRIIIAQLLILFFL